MKYEAALSAICLALMACTPQPGALTNGADTEEEWQRRLYAAVPVGMAGDSGRRVLVSAGFNCREGVDSVAYIWCDKQERGSVVTKRWQAVLNLDQGRVFERRASYGLIGP